MQRIVQPELLDELPAEHALAIGSRRDLIRLNRIMGHVGIFHRHLRSAFARKPARRIVELGSGDGTFLLQLARRLGHGWSGVEVTLVDREPVVAAAMLDEFERIGWTVRVERADVFAWLEEEREPCDLMLANLFLHHFEAPVLQRLLGLIAARGSSFAACEPRRSAFALVSARMLGLIGCNRVTRHDAVVSVRAGFGGSELSALWPSGAEAMGERPAGIFSHFFSVVRS